MLGSAINIKFTKKEEEEYSAVALFEKDLKLETMMVNLEGVILQGMQEKFK